MRLGGGRARERRASLATPRVRRRRRPEQTTESTRSGRPTAQGQTWPRKEAERRGESGDLAALPARQDPVAREREAALSALPDVAAEAMPCYEHKPGLNLEGAWPPAEQMCTYRFMSLAEAQAVCSSESRCDGVTIDGGVECVVERSEYASAFPDGLKWRFPYSCRSRPTKMWPANSGIGSWLKQRDGSTGSTCGEAKLGEERPTCPVRSKMAVAAHTPPPQQRAPPKKEPSSAVAGTSSAEDVEPHPPRAITHAAELERLSAAEATAIDAADIARGTCPSDIREAARLPTRCGGVVSWFEQLSELEQSTGGEEDCTAARAARCVLTHNGRPDGWGGQHFRRVRTFLSAVQLGCSYVHVPLFPMNANSQQHGIAHTAGEKFFGLSDYCYQGGPRGSRISCLEAFGNAPVDTQPLHVTHALAAVCNTTASGLLTAWHDKARGRQITCEEAIRVPPLSRCALLRASAALRSRYFAAHRGVPPLPWFDSAGPIGADAGGGIGGIGGRGIGGILGGVRGAVSSRSSLGVHVAVHVRRGDLRERAISRWVSNNQMTRVMSDLVNALTEVRALWDEDNNRAAASSSAAAAPPLPSPRLPLAIHVHVMTQNDWSHSERLPKRAWSALCLGANLTFTAHVDTDPFVTMHHLIAADVLVKSNSGYSDVAAAYSAGVKLFFTPSREIFYSGVGPLEPFGLRDAATRTQFVCALLSHLRYKAALPQAAMPPQARHHATSNLGQKIAGAASAIGAAMRPERAETGRGQASSRASSPNRQAFVKANLQHSLEEKVKAKLQGFGSPASRQAGRAPHTHTSKPR